MKTDETAATWAAAGPSTFRKPAKLNKSQAAELASANRLIKKSGKAIHIGNSPIDKSKRQIVIRTQADADKTSKIRGRI